MNKYIADTFSSIKSAADDYQGGVKSALMDYRRTMEKATAESKQYKDESSYIDSKKAVARRAAQYDIQCAENAFTGFVKAEVKSLRDDLHQHLTTRPSPAFLDALRIYSDFDLTPSHAEIEAILALNGGCSLGYRALNQVLRKTSAEYTVDAPDASAFEADIAALQKLARGNIRFIPDGFTHEMSEIYSGETRLFMRDDGTVYSNGFKWDVRSLLMASVDHKQAVAAIDAMAERWSSNVLPTLKHITAYKDTTDPKTGETITAARQMAKDIRATATAPEIERSEQPAVEMAREMAKQKAGANERANEATKNLQL